MKDLFLQRELRMEVQMAELTTRKHTLSAVPQRKKPKFDTPTTSDIEVVPARTPDPPTALRASLKAVTKDPKPPEVTKKSPRVIRLRLRTKFFEYCPAADYSVGNPNQGQRGGPPDDNFFHSRLD